MRIRRLRPAVRQQFGSQEALARAHIGQAVQLQGARMRQVVHAPVVAAEAHEGARQESHSGRKQLRFRRRRQRFRLGTIFAVRFAVSDSDAVDRFAEQRRKRRKRRNRPLNGTSDQLIRVVRVSKRGRNAHTSVDRTFTDRHLAPSPPDALYRRLLKKPLPTRNNPFVSFSKQILRLLFDLINVILLQERKSTRFVHLSTRRAENKRKIM